MGSIQVGPAKPNGQGGARRILWSSTIFGIRQSQWLAKQVDALLEVTSELSVARKVVNSVPLAVVPGLVAVQMYALTKQVTSPVHVEVDFSQIRPVLLSVTVPSPLST
jgi:hypothetical protein